MSEKRSVSEMFGCNVFNDSVMRERLPKAVYKDLKKTIEEGTELNPAIADVVANEMKEWALEKGATHFTPLVPADDRCDGREARCFYHPDGKRKSAPGILRERTDQG